MLARLPRRSCSHSRRAPRPHCVGDNTVGPVAEVDGWWLTGWGVARELGSPLTEWIDQLDDSDVVGQRLDCVE